ncbi:MAG: 3-deoxy-D-manno-octulosonic-acid transferase [uncultured bacterium]|nr:MAG: 3-deoxy-D-manno-octulosonic-acid transferase [uncultured bacterium]
MLIFSYNFLLTLLLILGFPFWIFIIFKEKYRLSILRKLCIYDKPENIPQNLLMIHAVSVGEINAAIPFIETIQQKHPDFSILITCSTVTGYNNAKSKIKNCLIEYYPLDFLWCVKRFFYYYPVKKIFIFETEFWPNLINQAHLKKIPMFLINCRISEKSFPRYKIIQSFLWPFIDKIEMFYCQTSLDAARLKSLSIYENKIKIINSIKFDAAVLHFNKMQDKKIQLKFQLNEKARIFLAGSTQEEENLFCLKAYLDAKKEFSDLNFILVPRKPESIDSTINYLNKNNIPFSLRSKIDTCDKIKDILIVDTIGELFNLYSFASVVFVGKSLVFNGGGQNPIEPAVFGKPVLMGKYYSNFQEIVDQMVSSDSIVIVNSPEELLINLKILLNNPQKMSKISSNAKSFVFGKASVCDRILKELL